MDTKLQIAINGLIEIAILGETTSTALAYKILTRINSMPEEKEDHQGYRHYTMNVIVSTKEDDFSYDKMFVLISNAIQNGERQITASPINQTQNDNG